MLVALESTMVTADLTPFFFAQIMLSMLAIVLIFWTQLVNTAKRLRDVGANPWISVLLLLMAIPIGIQENGVSWTLFIIAVLCTLPLIFMPSRAEERPW